MAVDRTNANVTYLVSALQPAVLRLIKQVIDQGHKAGIWVGMCGEMAGEPLAIPILLGFSLDEFSMNPPAIPQAKAIIRRWDTEDARSLAEQALLCETPEEVESLVANWSNDREK
jgi:phosphotransferase system enzyme I (PtsI)